MNFNLLCKAVVLVDLVCEDIGIESPVFVDHLLAAIKRNVRVDYLVFLFLDCKQRSIKIPTNINHFFKVAVVVL